MNYTNAKRLDQELDEVVKSIQKKLSLQLGFAISQPKAQKALAKIIKDYNLLRYLDEKK